MGTSKNPAKPVPAAGWGGIVAAFVWFGGTHDYRNLPTTADGPWVAFGDSLTEGYGASPGNDFPSLLGKRLGIDIQNLGKTGETSEDGLNRVDAVVALKPRVALVCFGGNDALQGKAVSQTTANLAQIIDRLHGEGTFVVLIGIRSASLRDRNESQSSQVAVCRTIQAPGSIRSLSSGSTNG